MPDNGAYLALGISIVVGILAVYAGSLFIRFGQTNKMIRTLEALKDEK